MLENDLLLRVVLLLAATLTIMGFVLFARMSRTTAPQPSQPAAPPEAPLAAAVNTTLAIPFPDTMIEQMTLDIYRRAFGAASFNYSVLGEHQAVLDAVRAAVPGAITRREYFPRKPLIIPRLLSALKNDDSSLKEFVDIIMQDPVLTGDVLRLANSSFYRVTKEPVDSIGRAVVLLGVEGLRSLIAASLMQPVFQVPRGYFDDFSTTIWELAQSSACAAQAYARHSRECDSFTAHLLTLLYHMSYIVLFRIAVAKYVDASGSLPRAEVFARIIDERAEQLTGMIATEWDMPEAIQEALAQHASRTTLNTMSPLARSLYFGRICGMGSMLSAQGSLDEPPLLELLERKGIRAEQVNSFWHQASPQLRERA